MIVQRKELTFWERLYLPAILGGLKVTWRHFRKTFLKVVKPRNDNKTSAKLSTFINSKNGVIFSPFFKSWTCI